MLPATPTAGPDPRTVQQLADLDRDRAQAVGHMLLYLNDHAQGLVACIVRFGRFAARRATLRGQDPDPAAIAKEVTELVLTVPRFAAGGVDSLLDLRAERVVELRRISHPRLAQVDPLGDAQRVFSLQPAVAAAGGIKAMARLLEARINGRVRSVNPQLDEAHRQQHARLTEQLAPLDPRTTRAADLQLELDRLNQVMQGLFAQDAARRRADAENLLTDSAAGCLKSLRELAPMASVISGDFEAAVRVARGSPAELEAIVAYVIEADQNAKAAVKDAAEAQARRMS